MKFIFIILFNCFAQAQITNPVAFIGEKVLGAIQGAPLTVDSNGGLISGLPTITSSTSTTTITTTSTSDVVMTGVTLTPLSGTYHVHCSTTFSGNSNNANIFMSVYAGGSQIAASQIEATPQIQSGLSAAFNLFIPGTSIAEVTVNGSQAIDCRWHASAGTATSTNRVLLIDRVR